MNRIHTHIQDVPAAESLVIAPREPRNQPAPDLGWGDEGRTTPGAWRRLEGGTTIVTARNQGMGKKAAILATKDHPCFYSVVSNRRTLALIFSKIL
jgi:hypothetical protein